MEYEINAMTRTQRCFAGRALAHVVQRSETTSQNREVVTYAYADNRN